MNKVTFGQCIVELFMIANRETERVNILEEIDEGNKRNNNWK